MLLQPDTYKDMLMKSLRFLVPDDRVIIYGIVIMHLHIHFIWQIQAGYRTQYLQRDFLQYVYCFIITLERNIGERKNSICS